MEKPTVLIIDDHQLIRDMWTRVLEDSGQVTVLKIQGRLTQPMALEMIHEKKTKRRFTRCIYDSPHGF